MVALYSPESTSRISEFWMVTTALVFWSWSLTAPPFICSTSVVK